MSRLDEQKSQNVVGQNLYAAETLKKKWGDKSSSIHMRDEIKIPCSPDLFSKNVWPSLYVQPLSLP